MSDYEEIEEEMKVNCSTCVHDGVVGASLDLDKCWGCGFHQHGLSNYSRIPTAEPFRYMNTAERLYVDPDYDVDLADFRFQGQKVIAKKVRPVWTKWKQTEVHKDIRRSARRSRRVFKQYLKTGSLRLLKAAEKKITSWDFD
jgi:hypothetical protein